MPRWGPLINVTRRFRWPPVRNSDGHRLRAGPRHGGHVGHGAPRLLGVLNRECPTNGPGDTYCRRSGEYSGAGVALVSRCRSVPWTTTARRVVVPRCATTPHRASRGAGCSGALRGVGGHGGCDTTLGSTAGHIDPASIPRAVHIPRRTPTNAFSTAPLRSTARLSRTKGP
jgi:hypothetical protein